MMNVTQHLLGKLAEESAEVGQIAIKTQHFGFHEICPYQPFTNAQRIHQELDDQADIVEMLNDLGLEYARDKGRIQAKKEKVVHYLGYSVELGHVNPGIVDLNLLTKLTSRVYASDGVMCGEDVQYLLTRLERILELVNDGSHHMAAAKLMADISALKSINVDTTA